MNIIEVNVSALAPPEPMQVILSSLATLPNGAVLKVVHRREPFPLYEQLVATGWLYHCKRLAEESFAIYIANEKDQLTFSDFIASNI
ncbi:DUF2249 domain-containing protein [Cognaticolwellia mytili]|uniref:DUF2249 domain-containing protein n=1 Tax=Cognaticolwellia mytili TaxID=1888913 RepID=UPI000A16FB0C|nr:DUF2249 domain-containing protein [Cognaticolwellia mytili]